MAIMEWFKVNGYNFIYGSLRLDPPINQLIFIKLLAMTSISRVPGIVCIANKVPYPMDVLAATLGVGEKELTEAIEYHSKLEQNRLCTNDWGGIEITNWANYQSKAYLRVRIHREKKRKEKNRREENRGICNAPVTDDNASVTKDGCATVASVAKEPRNAPKRTKFTKPTSEQVSEYAKGISFQLDGEYFCDYYETRGWKLAGGQAMKNWQAAVRTWKQRNLKDGKERQNGYKPTAKTRRSLAADGDIKSAYGDEIQTDKMPSMPENQATDII